MTVTPMGGEPTTTSLDGTDGWWSSGSSPFFGTISYSYSATWSYTWIPSYEGDEPVDQEYSLSIDSTVNLTGTSSAGFYSANASGSVTTLGSTNSVSGTNTEHYPDANDMTITGGGTHTHSQTALLSGEDGTFGFTIAGNIDTGNFGVFYGDFAIQTQIPTFDRVKIKSPANNAAVTHNVAFQVKVKWFAPEVLLPNANMRILIEVKPAGSANWTTKAAVSITPAGAFQVGGTVTANITISTVGVADIKATLQTFDGPTNNFVTAGGQNNPDLKSLVVN